ncbi:MAG: large subunit ribosomal protein [Solirubrobacteraceae bacterium]|jgi:large subunit ribosomal protein L25|nr:large subunit ribosomal protein [Solirubrobacteraceae bacterium]
MASQSTKLDIASRKVEGSRATRRLRRTGRVPGVLYGGGDEPLAFSVDARELRHALAGRGAVLEVGLDGTTAPAVLKRAQHHPVRGETIHVDLLRVSLDVAIHAVVPLELEGVDDAPGTKEGGVLEHVTREINIEALPTEIPESLHLDVSEMQINDTLTLAAVPVPAGVTVLDDVDETVVATLTPPRLEVEETEIEEETELVGGEAAEGAAPAEDAAAGDDSGDGE